MVLLQGACKLTNLFNPFRFSSCRISTSQISLKTSVEEKLGIKPKPKRPPSAFIRYVAQVKPQILQEKPDATVPEINKIASMKWRNVDNQMKQTLTEAYRKDWVKYQNAIESYNKTLTPVERDQIQKALSDIAQTKERRKFKQRMEELGKPKKPPSTYVLFMKSKILERGSTQLTDWQKSVKKDWEEAPASLKSALNEQYKREYESYKTSLKQWEKKMKSQGEAVPVRKQHT